MTTTVRVLPANPNLEQLKKQAKELLSSHQKGDVSVCGHLRLLKECSNLDDRAILAKSLKLHDAQRALALGYGFESWNAMKTSLENQRLSTSKKVLTDRLNALPDGQPVHAILLGNDRVVVARMGNPLKQGIDIQELTEFPIQGDDSIMAALSHALSESASQFKERNSTCFFACPPQNFYLRFFNTDAKGKSNAELGRILENEVKAKVPFPMDDVLLDYDFKVKGDQCEATFLVHKKSLALEIAGILSEHGMNPIFFTSSLLSVVNSLFQSDEASWQPRMLVRVYGKMTELTFFSKKNVFMRIIPVGLYGSHNNTPFGVDTIFKEILRSVKVYEKQQSGEMESVIIDDAFKTELAELQAMLSEEFKVETEFVDLDAFSGAKRVWSGKASPGALSELAGLALTPTSRALYNLCFQLSD